MRIALLTDYFPPHAPGGAEWSTEALARALAARDHGVTVITPNWGAAPIERRDGFTIRRFACPVKRPPGRAVVPQRVLANPLFYLYAGLQIARLARRERADILHAQTKPMLVPSVIARTLIGTPTLLTLRNASLIDPAPMCLHHHDQRPADCGVRKLWRECSVEYFDNYMRDRGRSLLRTRLAFLYGWLDATYLRQRVLRRVDAVVGVSEGILGVHRRSGLLDGQRLETIYTIPRLDVPSTEADGEAVRRRYGLASRIVLYVGKRSPGKGVADFLAAAQSVHDRHRDAQFVLVGEGRMAASPGLWIRHLDPLPHTEVLALYAAADVVVVPSVIPEAFSRVVLEAMTAGRAIVATAVGGMPELIEDGESGLLVPRSDPAALAAAIARLLDDPALAARLGAAARRRVETRFSPDASVDRLLALYATVLAA